MPRHQPNTPILQPVVLAPVGNGAEEIIGFTQPYTASVTITGTAPFLFHRWNIEAVAEKAGAAKGSRAKREDNLESFVYRNSKGDLALPGEYLRQAVCHAAKYKQDPRSPRKSMMDLVKAGIVVVDEYCSFGVKDWDYIDRRRVLIQRNAITRSRPAMATGWKVTVVLTVIMPEYVESRALNELIQMAGRLIGVGDFRPSHGRFQIVKFEVLK